MGVGVGGCVWVQVWVGVGWVWVGVGQLTEINMEVHPASRKDSRNPRQLVGMYLWGVFSMAEPWMQKAAERARKGSGR